MISMNNSFPVKNLFEVTFTILEEVKISHYIKKHLEIPHENNFGTTYWRVYRNWEHSRDSIPSIVKKIIVLEIRY